MNPQDSSPFSKANAKHLAGLLWEALRFAFRNNNWLYGILLPAVLFWILAGILLILQLSGIVITLASFVDWSAAPHLWDHFDLDNLDPFINDVAKLFQAHQNSQELEYLLLGVLVFNSVAGFLVLSYFSGYYWQVLAGIHRTGLSFQMPFLLQGNGERFVQGTKVATYITLTQIPLLLVNISMKTIPGGFLLLHMTHEHLDFIYLSTMFILSPFALAPIVVSAKEGDNACFFQPTRMLRLGRRRYLPVFFAMSVSMILFQIGMAIFSLTCCCFGHIFTPAILMTVSPIACYLMVKAYKLDQQNINEKLFQ